MMLLAQIEKKLAQLKETVMQRSMASKTETPKPEASREKTRAEARDRAVEASEGGKTVGVMVPGSVYDRLSRLAKDRKLSLKKALLLAAEEGLRALGYGTEKSQG